MGVGVGGDAVEKGKGVGGGGGKEGQRSSKSKKKKKGRNNKHSSYDFFFCCCSVKRPSLICSTVLRHTPPQLSSVWTVGTLE